jgi:hypothetical protein
MTANCALGRADETGYTASCTGTEWQRSVRRQARRGAISIARLPLSARSPISVMAAGKSARTGPAPGAAPRLAGSTIYPPATLMEPCKTYERIIRWVQGGILGGNPAMPLPFITHGFSAAGKGRGDVLLVIAQLLSNLNQVEILANDSIRRR